MKTTLMIVAATLLALPAAAQQPDAPNSHDPAFLRRPANHRITSFDSVLDEEHAFRDSAGAETVMRGTRYRIGYEPLANARRSVVSLVDHFRGQVNALGGSVRHEERFPAVSPTFARVVYRLVRGGRDHWFDIQIENGGAYFTVTMVERAAPAGVGPAPITAALPVGAAPRPRFPARFSRMAVTAGAVRTLPAAALARPAMAPVVQSVLPARVEVGDMLVLQGRFIHRAVQVDLVDSRGEPWPVRGFAHDDCENHLRLIVPGVPAGSYRIAVRTPDGADRSAASFTVFQNPQPSEPPDGAARGRRAAGRMIDLFATRGLITDQRARQLRNGMTNDWALVTVSNALFDVFQDTALQRRHAEYPLTEIAMLAGQTPARVAQELDRWAWARRDGDDFRALYAGMVTGFEMGRLLISASLLEEGGVGTYALAATGCALIAAYGEDDACIRDFLMVAGPVIREVARIYIEEDVFEQIAVGKTSLLAVIDWIPDAPPGGRR